MRAAAPREKRSERQPLATAQQVAEYLGVPVETLHNWRTKKCGPPAAKIAGKLRYAWADVDAWVDQRKGAA